MENEDNQENAAECVEFSPIPLKAMFDDAFNAIARDGAGNIEIALRLQKAFQSLSTLSSEAMAEVSREHAQLAFRYAEEALPLEEEIKLLKKTGLIKSR